MLFQGRVRVAHFVGIGGIGMSGLAEVLLAHGVEVTGSDLSASETTHRLSRLGATVFHGHAASQLGSADVVVRSSAIGDRNPEIVAAGEQGIAVVARAELLAELMRAQAGIAVAGSHGKTTTTSLLATVLREAGLDPTIVAGGKLNLLDSNAVRGHGQWLVAEADESDGSFLLLRPVIAAITNIDPEHLDHYGSERALQDAFVAFANSLPFYGLAVACVDHPGVAAILPRVSRPVATYGMGADADYRASAVFQKGLSTTFELTIRGQRAGTVGVAMPGEHNVYNALAVIAVADTLGVPLDVTTRALSGFSGVQRRFSVLGEAAGVTVVDDYGHHPAEVVVTLRAARSAYAGRIVVAFQPHRYSRTRDTMDELGRAFEVADEVWVSDVYAAGELPIAGADSATLCETIKRTGHANVRHVARIEDLAGALQKTVTRGDVVITMGAGSITGVGPVLLRLLASPDADGGQAPKEPAG